MWVGLHGVASLSAQRGWVSAGGHRELRAEQRGAVVFDTASSIWQPQGRLASSVVAQGSKTKCSKQKKVEPEVS